MRVNARPWEMFRDEEGIAVVPSCSLITFLLLWPAVSRAERSVRRRPQRRPQMTIMHARYTPFSRRRHLVPAYGAGRVAAMPLTKRAYRYVPPTGKVPHAGVRLAPPAR